MWAQVDRILRQAASQIADHVANFLPGLLVAVLLVAVTVVAAVATRSLLLRTLRGLDFDRRADWFRLAVGGWPASVSASVIVARVAAWTVLVVGLLVSLTALNATIPSRLALSAFEYLPHLLAASAIVVVGTLAAQFLSRSTLIGAVNMRFGSARLLSLTVKWLVLLVTVAMALDHLGIGRSVLLLAFGILFGGVVFAAALAVGLGARDAVREAIDRRLHEPAAEDKVDHV
jgi:hypothetical protein